MEEESGTIQQETLGDVTVVSLVGEHDLTTVDTLQARLQALAGAGSTGGLVVSVSETKFLDSSIVHALFSADEQLRRRDRRLVLHFATASIVKRVIEVSGLNVLPSSSSKEQAAVIAARSQEGTEWSTS